MAGAPSLDPNSGGNNQDMNDIMMMIERVPSYAQAPGVPPQQDFMMSPIAQEQEEERKKASKRIKNKLEGQRELAFTLVQ